MIKYDINLEFIIIANDITIEEEKILNRYRIENLILYKVPRETLYESWNRGISKARYNILTFWNVDDIRFPKAFEKGCSYINQGIQIVYFPFVLMGIRKVTFFQKRFTLRLFSLKFVKAVQFDKEVFMKGCMGGPFFMFHRSVIESIGFFDGTFIVAGDFDWFARAAYNNIVFKKIDKPGGIFFTHSGNLTVTNSKIQARENKRILGKYGFFSYNSSNKYLL